MNIRLLRVFNKFSIIPRYRVKLGERYNLQAIGLVDIPHDVTQSGMTRTVKSMEIGKHELARLIPRNELVHMTDEDKV